MEDSSRRQHDDGDGGHLADVAEVSTEILELEVAYLRETVMDTLNRSFNNPRQTASVLYIKRHDSSSKDYLFVKRLKEPSIG